MSSYGLEGEVDFSDEAGRRNVERYLKESGLENDEEARREVLAVDKHLREICERLHKRLIVKLIPECFLYLILFSYYRASELSLTQAGNCSISFMSSSFFVSLYVTDWPSAMRTSLPARPSAMSPFRQTLNTISCATNSETQQISVIPVQSNVVELERPIRSQRGRLDLEPMPANAHIGFRRPITIPDVDTRLCEVASDELFSDFAPVGIAKAPITLERRIIPYGFWSVFPNALYEKSDWSHAGGSQMPPISPRFQKTRKNE